MAAKRKRENSDIVPLVFQSDWFISEIYPFFDLGDLTYFRRVCRHHLNSITKILPVWTTLVENVVLSTGEKYPVFWEVLSYHKNQILLAKHEDRGCDVGDEWGGDYSQEMCWPLQILTSERRTFEIYELQKELQIGKSTDTSAPKKVHWTVYSKKNLYVKHLIMFEFE